jgi:hypothetical protein
MNTGRLTGPCGNVSKAALAFVVEHFATASKVNALFINDLIVMSMGVMQRRLQTRKLKEIKSVTGLLRSKVPILSNWDQIFHFVLTPSITFHMYQEASDRYGYNYSMLRLK